MSLSRDAFSSNWKRPIWVGWWNYISSWNFIQNCKEKNNLGTQPQTMALFFHWLSLLLQSFCQLKQVQSTSLKSSVVVGDTILLYSNFFTFPHHKLNSTSSIEPHAVDSEDECIAECNENPQCRSLNFKPVAEADGKHICHLLDADMFTSPESFNSSSEFHHFSFTVSRV